MKKNIQIWIASIALFGVSLLYSLWFLNKKNLTTFIILMLMLAVSSVLYYMFSKKIKMPGGYTAVQAWLFYRRCLKSGLKTFRKFLSHPDEKHRVVQHFDFSKELDDNALKQLFHDGKMINYIMTNKNYK